MPSALAATAGCRGAPAVETVTERHAAGAAGRARRGGRRGSPAAGGGTTGAIAFWMQPAWGESSQDDASLVTFGDGVVRLIKNLTFLPFEVLDDAGTQAGLGAPVAEWRAGEWHQVVATRDGRVIWLFVDGALVSTGAQPGPIPLPPGTPVHIGSAFPPGRPVAPAALADVSIRARALTPNAVAKRFLRGPRPGG